MKPNTTDSKTVFQWDEKAVEDFVWKTFGDPATRYKIEQYVKSKLKEAEQPKRIKVGKMSCREGEQGFGEMKWNLQFKTNTHIHYDKAIELCNLLETFLNNEAPDIPTLSRQDNVFNHDKINKQLDRIHYLQALGCDLISRIYHYGNFKAETLNERKLEEVLNELKLFPTTEDEILKRPPLPENKLSNTIQDKGDWEIVAYNNYNICSGGGVRVKEKDGKFYFENANNKVGYSDWQLSDWDIHSVRRIGDNVVLSIDDVTSEGKITGFAASKDVMSVQFENGLRSCGINVPIKLPPK